MMKNIMFIFLLLLWGCSSSAGLAMRTDSQEMRQDSITLAGKLQIENLQKKQSGQQLQVWATLVSLTNKQQALQYKFTFFDSDGMALEQDSQSWHAVHLHGSAQYQVSAVSIVANAVEAELVVRRAQ